MSEDMVRVKYGLNQVIATGWEQYWLHFKSILWIFIIVYVPVNFALSFVPVGDLGEAQGMRGFQTYMKFARISEFIFGVLATMALATIIEGSIQRNHITWQGALRHAVSRWGASIGTGFLAGLIIFGLLLLLIVPGIIWSLYYSLVVYVVALRSLSGKDALDYSKRLVKGQWWRVLGYLFVIQLIGALAGIIITAPFFFAPEWKILNIVSSTLCDIATALATAMTVVFFLNNDYLKNPPAQAVSPEIQGASG